MNRSNTTTYAKQNGGDFEFVISGPKSLPTEERFWDYLFLNAKKWGLSVYEQVGIFGFIFHFL